ncbi:hypothetical protein LJR175_007608 [Variovorax sp. LjRoot175]|uniref:hypothetical protein n=1 Tax=Variovorax sp. LjRoot175 TaxID=3342276 RepID=UPI003ECF1AC2
MKVIIANFGRGNYLWPQCLERSTVATIEDVPLRPFFLSGDRKGYIDLCMATMKTVRGHAPTRAVASRWFNIGLEIAETNGDMWVHREKDEIWWTITKPNAAEAELQPAHLPSYAGQMVYAIHKPAQEWSNRDRNGRRLDWAAIHPKAKDFLFTESTLVRFSADNAEYVHTLINGGDLAPWHERKVWRDKLGNAKRAPVVIFNPIQMAALRMVTTAIATVAASNGQIVERTQKNKNHMFDSEEEFRRFVEGLILDQEGFCALSGLPLQYDSTFEDAEMLASLDRIDSEGHYEPCNLQVVCRFINRWKNNDKDETFTRLLAVVREG